MKTQDRASLITILVALVIGAAVALAGSSHSAAVDGLALFALAVCAAFVIQILVYVPSMLARNERFFDLTGSLTFIVVSIGVLALSPDRDVRSWVLAAMVIIWAVRLGSFLFSRIHRARSDDRFDQIKSSPIRFLQVWVMQGLWVAVTASAAWIAMSAPADDRPTFGWLGGLGVLVWAVGLGIEVTADLQKQAFRADPRNDGQFIRTGLWARSRHPNYFGEIILWIGVFLVAAPVLVGWQWIALLSPLLVIVLLTRISGVPLLEAKADKKWGGQADYEAYKASTPTLIPRLR